MLRDEDEDTTIYRVVVNHEEQYSIWPLDRENPLGWRDTGRRGIKTECLAYIDEVWTDMRPLSLRKEMGRGGLAKRVREAPVNGTGAGKNEEPDARLASEAGQGGR